MNNKYLNHRLFFKSLIIGVSILSLSFFAISELTDIEGAKIFYAYYLTIPSAVLVFVSVWSLQIHMSSSIHRSAWIAFLGYAITWMIGNILWEVEYYLHNVPGFPSSADIMYFMGYSFFFMFLVLYIEPIISKINKKLFYIALAASALMIVLLIPIGYGMDDTDLTNMFLLVYPISAAVLIIPSIIGISTFFGGRLGLVLLLLFIGICLSYVGDIFFLDAYMTDMDYKEIISELFFLVSTLFWICGVAYNIMIFKK